MKSMRIIGFLLTIMLGIIVGCTSSPDAVVDIPTLAQLPTATITHTPTLTLTPSDTPTATWTFSPTVTYTRTFTHTPTYTATTTLTPSQTLSPTATSTPTATFTPTFTPSFTPSETFTFTPRPTLTSSPTTTRTALPTLTPLPTLTFTPLPTPTYTPTFAGPTVFSFGSNYQSILPRSSVTFAFSSNGDGGRLEQLNNAGAVVQVFPVFPTGSYSIIAPDNYGRLLTYRFVATRAGIEAARTLQISITCPTNWFFGDQYAPANAGCPAALAAVGDGRFQTFERGLMLFVNANGLNRIYGLQDSGSLYISYANGWDGTTINNTPSPSDRLIPDQMFNWVYYSTLAPIGSWRDTLGWGTISINTDARSIQWENAIGGTNPFYIDAPGGAVYRFSGGESGSWARVK